MKAWIERKLLRKLQREMARLRTLKPRVATAPTRIARVEIDRQATRKYNTNLKAWKLLRQQVLVRDGYQCRACGRLVVGRDAHVDHIDGDDSNNDLNNLQTLCHEGHSRKTWAEQNGRKWDGRCGGRPE